MKIAIVGGGGREHALAWKIKQSPLCDNLFCLPGNAGTAEIATNIDISAEDLDGVVGFCKEKAIDLVAIGPENPLADGIVDRLSEVGIKAFGPSKKAAQLEASKSFTKDFLKKYNIPTAEYETFTSFEDAKAYIEKKGAPIVVKADGLAAGKGVTVAKTKEEAIKALKSIFIEKRFGEAGNRVVIEEFLEGEEASFLVFSDGENILPMIAAQDHKPIYNNDEGPNTGGMGSYAPAPIVDENLKQYIIDNIMKKAIDGMKKEEAPYKGVLYAGLMIKDKKPYVLEFNCRFGDPETQAILPLLKSDIVQIMLATIEGNLNKYSLSWKEGYAVGVVLASGGYPLSYEKGKPIIGLDKIVELDDVIVFHAGTKLKDGQILTNGGRVLNVVGMDKDFRTAQEKAYNAIKFIHFDRMHYRTDIGNKAYKYL
ncbi:phosphoribosylamine--glycine ligase [Hippea maritima]|uniref:Phosphoribosylamine--glycine ligase n=1 Tax=Hippea maritima (strain ATCC 700847 / DSM 10411 / MH2) TaxID=760142 RepID=F2LUW3_HIPMA|nr:phosphoribosylamine--glycine ligase [Hippea maritima]AEA33568.1 Phosphoribosylamine--glycine ligase [Hippea maritima DSM 10411]